MSYSHYDERTTKKMVIDAMANGYSWKEAVARAHASISRRTAYRWWASWFMDGDAVFQERRHGHAWLLDEPAQDWIVAYCQAHPHTPSHALQVVLRTERSITVSVSQINIVRARRGVTYQRPRHEKKGPS